MKQKFLQVKLTDMQFWSTWLIHSHNCPFVTQHKSKWKKSCLGAMWLAKWIIDDSYSIVTASSDHNYQTYCLSSCIIQKKLNKTLRENNLLRPSGSLMTYFLHTIEYKKVI